MLHCAGGYSRTMRVGEGRVEGDGGEVGGSDGGNCWSQCRARNDMRSETRRRASEGE